MSHGSHCIRSDGDWICGGGCTVRHDEATHDACQAAYERGRHEVAKEIVTMLHRAGESKAACYVVNQFGDGK